MLSDAHARTIITRIYTQNKILSDNMIAQTILLNKALSQANYTIRDISVLVKKAFEKRWDTTRDIKNYRNLNLDNTMITCIADVNWARPGSDKEIDEGFIELFITDSDKIVINVICSATGEIRQAHINPSNL